MTIEQSLKNVTELRKYLHLYEGYEIYFAFDSESTFTICRHPELKEHDEQIGSKYFKRTRYFGFPLGGLGLSEGLKCFGYADENIHYLINLETGEETFLDVNIPTKYLLEDARESYSRLSRQLKEN
jgi:hypothetical protein